MRQSNRYCVTAVGGLGFAVPAALSPQLLTSIEVSTRADGF